eukprot:TRINITY_DN7998_c0_g1_i2.p1 TRINITY_DN7998_c0_g1~~TRINITY_DN7998_c0_g1_i2.p1  ORF type:complete len:694 (+),score=123.87 TRINITY_DN7998_c0_g1_i2:95-2083(+)
MLRSLVGSEMCIRDRLSPDLTKLEALCRQLRGLPTPGASARSQNSSQNPVAGVLYTGPRSTMVLCASEYTSKHLVPSWHVEQPSRTQTVEARIRQLADLPGNQIVVLDVSLSPGAEQILGLVHQPGYLHFLINRSKAVEESGKPFDTLNLSGMDHDTFTSLHSYRAALASSSVICQAVDVLMKGISPSAFCCVRPPGHHAGRSGGALGECSQGFCLVNNVCAGIAYARVQYRLARVCIVDLDVHHGNGTQDIVAGDDETLFMSVHRYGDEFFPKFCGRTTPQNQMGGNVVNVGLPEGFDGPQWREAICRFVERIERFKPEMIFISAGFDGHNQDPIGGAGLTEEDFYWATDQIQQLASTCCNGRVISVLEGGYHIPALANCAAAHVCALSGREMPEVAEYAATAANSAGQNSLIEQVSAAMKSQGKSQSQVANEAGLSSNGLVSLWLNHKLPLRPDVDAKIAGWLQGQPGGLVVQQPRQPRNSAPEFSPAYQQHLRDTLLGVMRDNGLSQSAIARELETWPSYISMFIKGKPFPRSGQANLIAWMTCQGATVQDASEFKSEPVPDEDQEMGTVREEQADSVKQEPPAPAEAEAGLDSLESMSVAALKQLIQSQGRSFIGCTEKRELVRLARMAVTPVGSSRLQGPFDLKVPDMESSAMPFTL